MKTLLVIGFVYPEPKSSAAGSRMLQLISLFQSQGYKVTFATTCTDSTNAFDLRSIDVSVTEIALNNASFDDFLIQLNPDVVLFDRFMIEEQFGWRVAEHCPNALRVLDTEDLHCLRKGRHAAIKANKDFNDTYLFNDIAKREIASIYRCDVSLMISEVEVRLLQNKFKVDTSLMYYLPFLLEESSKATNQLPNFETRAHFVTIGNFLHNPNYDAVLYLKQTIWPLIRKQLPKAELHIYGAYTSQKVTQLHKPQEGFYIKGYAEDVNQVMQHAKVCLATLRFGAGLKGKLVDAMQNGTPCVMTSIAAEGMFGNLEANGLVADTREAIANSAVDLYANKDLWETSQQNGFTVVDKRFQSEAFKVNLLNHIQAIQDNLQAHRLQNFLRCYVAAS